MSVRNLVAVGANDLPSIGALEELEQGSPGLTVLDQYRLLLDRVMHGRGNCPLAGRGRQPRVHCLRCGDKSQVGVLRENKLQCLRNVFTEDEIVLGIIP